MIDFEKKNHDEAEVAAKTAGYTIECTGDAAQGDEVFFHRATFSGSFRNPKFSGMETVAGKIVNDSYGASKAQHSFTVEKIDGEKIIIKARNAYRNGLWRKPWTDESARIVALEEKHERGGAARATKEARNDRCQQLIAEGWNPADARDVTGATVRGAGF
ncbi:MAG: hypothetical protein WC822_07250 [Candidatus Paceibacterota bacterium]|jgi:hypothetical protein